MQASENKPLHHAHAYLIVGEAEEGAVIKATTLLQQLNCQSPSLEPRPCGSCGNCQKLQRGLHQDCFVLEPEGKGGQIKVEQVRLLIRELSLKSAEAPVKGAIIKQAHRLNEVSQNALLKTLEEPPGDVVIFLLTNQPEALLPTVRSRVRQETLDELGDRPDLSVFELAWSVFETLHQGAMAFYDKLAWLEGHPRLDLTPLLIAMEHLLRDGLIHSFEGESDQGAEMPVPMSPEGMRLRGTPEQFLYGLEALWHSQFYLDRAITTGLVMENLMIRLAGQKLACSRYDPGVEGEKL